MSFKNHFEIIYIDKYKRAFELQKPQKLDDRCVDLLP